MIIKYLLASILAIASVEMDESGWVAINHPETHAGRFEDLDHSIWVVFSKKMGPEKILLSFPEDPEYHALEEGRKLVAVASHFDATHELQVMEKTYSDVESMAADRLRELQSAPISRIVKGAWGESPAMDLIYWEGGQWRQERWISTPHHTYFLLTSTLELDERAHAQFADSLDIEVAANSSS